MTNDELLKRLRGKTVREGASWVEKTLAAYERWLDTIDIRSDPVNEVAMREQLPKAFKHAQDLLRGIDGDDVKQAGIEGLVVAMQELSEKNLFPK